MALQNLVHEMVRLLKLLVFACTRNNNITCLERKKSNLLTLPWSIALALTWACLLAHTNPWTTHRARSIVVILDIYTLVNQLLQRTEESILLRDNLVKVVPVNRAIHMVITVNQLNLQCLNKDWRQGDWL